MIINAIAIGILLTLLVGTAVYKGPKVCGQAIGEILVRLGITWAIVAISTTFGTTIPFWPLFLIVCPLFTILTKEN